jgi:hypothetical protein
MRCKYKELNEHCQLYQLMKSLPSFSTFAYKMFVQKSNVREKELANDVSVRNQILSIQIIFHKSFFNRFINYFYRHLM